MTAPRRRSLSFFFIVVVCLAGVALFRDIWLRALAGALVSDEPPVKADVAIVLAGDYTGRRLLRGAELVRLGFVPAAWVSGPDHFFGVHECDLAIPYAIREGYPAEYFVAFPHSALSTREEAEIFIPEMEKRGIRSVLLVTSDYHTARASRIFRAAARAHKSNVEIHPVAAYHPGRNAGNWWHTREGQKIVFYESVKTVATAIGL